MKMGKLPDIIIKENPRSLAHVCADIIASTADASIKKKGSFAIAISGGSTPRPIHRLLAREPYISDIPWDKMHLFWVDERWVPYQDPASNYGTAKEDFLDMVPLGPTQIHRMPVETTPEDGAKQYQKDLIDFFNIKGKRFPAFDLIILGIGKDGHTASLFPGQHALCEEEKMVMAIIGGDPFVYRLTLTLPVLNNAGKILFVVSGKGKSEILSKVLTQRHIKLPAQLVKPVNNELTWLVDRAASSKL